MGEQFSADVVLVSLGSCEMVLGIQWLSTLGPILWDFEQLRMEFKYEGRRAVLRGTQKSNVEWLRGKKMQHALHKSAQMFALQVRPVGALAAMVTSIECHLELLLLAEFADLFEESKSLSPHRERDHRILLKPRVSPINVSPYRYPALQKYVIEKTVQKMLQTGVISGLPTVHTLLQLYWTKRRMGHGGCVLIIGN